jgi:hypothetical protein
MYLYDYKKPRRVTAYFLMYISIYKRQRTRDGTGKVWTQGDMLDTSKQVGKCWIFCRESYLLMFFQSSWNECTVFSDRNKALEETATVLKRRQRPQL